MDVQIAVDIAERNQLRQAAGPGEINLTAILAHFRRYQLESELVADFLLARPGKTAPAGEQTIFVELPVTTSVQVGLNHGQLVKIGQQSAREGFHQSHLPLRQDALFVVCAGPLAGNCFKVAMTSSSSTWRKSR